MANITGSKDESSGGVEKRIINLSQKTQNLTSARSDCFSNQIQMWKKNKEDKICEFSEICERQK